MPTLQTLLFLGGLLLGENGCGLDEWAGVLAVGAAPSACRQRPMKSLSLRWALSCVRCVAVSVSALLRVLRGSAAPFKSTPGDSQDPVYLPVFTFWETNTCKNMIQIFCKRLCYFFL